MEGRIRTEATAGPAAVLAWLVLALAAPGHGAAQADRAPGRNEAALAQRFPDLHATLVRLERAQGVLYGRLRPEGEAVRARGDSIPTFGFEFDMVELLTAIANAEGTAEDLAAEADAGYRVLGARGAQVVARANAFHRELLGVYADTTVVDRRSAVEDVVDRYLSRADLALPAEPKDMDMLYDHPYAWSFRTGYADLGGLIWAIDWLRLAATEPLTDLSTHKERLAGMDTVTNRFLLKLSYGEPPAFFPSELPLTPSIAPGFVLQHPRASIILDNLHVMHDVLADILVSPDVGDVPAALDQAIEQFVDPKYRIADRDDWMTMALRHGIFNEGGPALGVMTSSERNSSGHWQHLQGDGGRVTVPGMPN